MSTSAKSVSAFEEPLETDILCGIVHLQSSCIPLSQYKSQAVCRRRRLRVIVFDKTALLSSDQVLSCTNTLCFWWRLQVLLYGTILGLSKLHRASLMLWSSSIGFTAVKKRIAFWDTVLLGSDCNVFKFNSIPDVVDTLGDILWQQYMILQWWIHNISSWMSWKYRKCLEELGFKQYWNLFFWPPPFARIDVQSSMNHCKASLNPALNSFKMSSNHTAPSSSRRILMFHVEEIWSSLLTLPDNLDWIFPY